MEDGVPIDHVLALIVKAITAAAAAWLLGADHLEDTGMIAFVSGASRSSTSLWRRTSRPDLHPVLKLEDDGRRFLGQDLARAP
jgi:hypothetical protein